MVAGARTFAEEARLSIYCAEKTIGALLENEHSLPIREVWQWSEKEFLGETRRGMLHIASGQD